MRTDAVDAEIGALDAPDFRDVHGAGELLALGLLGFAGFVRRGLPAKDVPSVVLGKVKFSGQAGDGFLDGLRADLLRTYAQRE